MKSRTLLQLDIYTLIITIIACYNAYKKNRNLSFDQSSYYKILGIFICTTILLTVLFYYQGEEISKTPLILFGIATCLCMWLTGQINKENKNNGYISKEDSFLAVTSFILLCVVSYYTYYNKDILVNSFNKLNSSINAAKNAYSGIDIKHNINDIITNK